MKISESLEKEIFSWKEMKAVFEKLKAWNTKDGGVFPLYINGLTGGLKGFFLSEYVKSFADSLLLVVPSEKEIEDVHADLDLSGLEVKVLPWWGGLAYRPVSVSAPVFSERARILSELAEYSQGRTDIITGIRQGEKRKSGIFVTTQRAFLTPVPPPDYIKNLNCRITAGGECDILKIVQLLVSWGYIRVPRVSLRGEFALRGEVLDICPASGSGAGNAAYRVQFNFDKVEKIRSFDLISQASYDEFEFINVCPGKEVIWDKERIDALASNLSRFPEFSEASHKLIDALKEHGYFEGEEIFYPLSFDKKYSVLDYFKKNGNFTVIYADYDRQKNAVETLNREYTGLYKKVKNELDEVQKRKVLLHEYPVPERILLDFEEYSASYGKSVFFKTISGGEERFETGENGGGIFNSFAESGREISFNKNAASGSAKLQTGLSIKFDTYPPRSFFGNIVYLKEELSSLIKDNWKIYIFAETENQALRIGEILKDFKVNLLPFSLSAGFGIPELKILVIHENEIFGRRRRIPKSVKTAKSSVIDTFVELNPGDYVVHVNYGIGLFKGIERVKVSDNERDYINLLYADGEVVFIPIEQADLVQRYIGNEGEAPRLDVLGSKSWENRKNRVKKSVEDIAGRLIDLYSRRKAAAGFAFQKDDEWQLAFEAAFPYEETEDQLTCIEEIKKDMQKPVPMDRLICGDVGYGKTEVAMRGAFKAVMAGKQVAFLAPTTVLAEQHFETLDRRFKNFPVKIEKMSRFVSKSGQKKIMRSLKDGEIDILVGTHRIIQKDVEFKDLGLIIIDEEQRFGVKDKERLKQMKTNVDCLSMSATPIPRTLHMSLLKIRDMSLITTPPQNRKPIETVIEEFNAEKVAEIIRRETARGGQVFYLHNRIETLEDTRFMLQTLLPELLIEEAHGQMPSDKLEEIFKKFGLGGFHVLIATTIIENGIDIPNANTIIIDRADMYGVSQLYQLRGRVGRSDKKAYAYLLYPENKSLTEIAMKRLQVISDFTELGSGFKIAMKDMEIRGAGNLLGKEQSGDIYSVGFDLYLRLLEEAVEALKNADYKPKIETVIELEYSGFIPDSYISVPETKMEIYKKIAAVKTQADLDGIIFEINDRFGPPPAEVDSLLSLSEIKVICNKLCIASLKERNSSVRVEFGKVSEISIDKLLRLIKESAGRIRLDPKHPNVIILETGKIGLKEKSEFIYEKLNKLV